ncbi:MAG: substrate-binding domain-containing protein [Pirellulales bacterium]|nr:substrate-binding domain-containing protein [Pirellulales bacterium]
MPAKKKRPARRTLPRVLLLVETTNTQGMEILTGISRYVEEHRPWSIYFQERAITSSLPSWTWTWEGDGIIARSATYAIHKRFNDMGLPRVELCGVPQLEANRVGYDTAKTGQLAADHLKKCGLTNFGFFAFGMPWWIKDTLDSFQAALGDVPCDVCVSSKRGQGVYPLWNEAQRRQVARWLKSLPKPVGILSPAGNSARTLLNICREIDIPVPEQVAVLCGVEDPILNQISTPSLSAIELDMVRLGYEAAGLLDRLMQEGSSRGGQTVQLPESFARVVPRESTDTIVVDNPDVARAVRYIRDHACSGITVREVADVACMGCRTLERQFLRLLGVTPAQEIRRVQLAHARFLLSSTDVPIESIGPKCGLTSKKYFLTFFRRHEGCTPGQFRRSCLRRYSTV